MQASQTAAKGPRSQPVSTPVLQDGVTVFIFRWSDQRLARSRAMPNMAHFLIRDQNWDTAKAALELHTASVSFPLASKRNLTTYYPCIILLISYYIPTFLRPTVRIIKGMWVSPCPFMWVKKEPDLGSFIIVSFCLLKNAQEEVLFRSMS